MRQLPSLGTGCATVWSHGAADPAATRQPFVKRGKNDGNDAGAIGEAASRPTMRFVPVKPAETQAEAMDLSARDLLVRQRTQLVNAVRGHAAEFGIIAAKGIAQVDPLLRKIAEADMPQAAGRKGHVGPTGQGHRAAGCTAGRDQPAPCRATQGQPGQPAPGGGPRRRAAHGADGGDESRRGPVRIRSALCGLAWPGAEGAIHRQPSGSRRHQPGRQRTASATAGRGSPCQLR